MPFGERVLFFQIDFPSPMGGGTSPTPSCYCWHLTGGEPNGRSEGQATPVSNPHTAVL